MSLKRRCVIEEAIGETRAAVYEKKRLVELYVRRWSERDKARAGDVFCGIIRKIDPSIGAAFMDLGASSEPSQRPMGFLKFTMAPNAPRFREGQRLKVEVTREAEAGKGPVLKYLSVLENHNPKEGASSVLGRLSGDNLDGFISKRFKGDVTFDTAFVNSIEEACLREIAVPNGGDIAIDFTRALVAIDVDKGHAQSGYTVSENVLPMIARQLRLRGIGGLIVIDLPNLRQPKQRERLYNLAQSAFKDDPNIIKIAPMSRFGTVEMTRSKPAASLDEILYDRFGEPTDETLALRAIRRLEVESRVHAGANLTLLVPERAKLWLDRDSIGWRLALTQKIGDRFTLAESHEIDVKSDR